VTAEAFNAIQKRGRSSRDICHRGRSEQGYQRSGSSALSAGADVQVDSFILFFIAAHTVRYVVNNDSTMVGVGLTTRSRRVRLQFYTIINGVTSEGVGLTR